MKIWNIFLKTKNTGSELFDQMIKNNMVSVCIDAKKHYSDNKEFIDAEKGDLFYLSFKEYPVKIIGMFKDNFPFFLKEDTGETNWIYREFEPIASVKSKKGEYEQNSKNSFESIEDILSFEKDILGSVFKKIDIKALLQFRSKRLLEQSVSMEKLQNLQLKFQKLADKKETTYLFQNINRLSQKEIQKLLFIYETKENIEKTPIDILRKEIVIMLKKGQVIDNTALERLKQTLSRNYDKDVYRNWKHPFNILFYLFYFQFEDEIDIYLNRFVKIVQKKLKIEDFTASTKPVHFSGTKGQGNHTVWFSLFNNTFSKQLHAYQLFLSIENGDVRYGLFHMDKKDKNEIAAASKLSLKNLLALFGKYIDLIKHDNSKEKAIFTETIDLLSYQKQIILQGPPGTGKTRLAKLMARYIVNGEIKPYIDDLEDQIRIIQFHPSYSYEDFVRGIVAESKGNQIEYTTKNKILVEMAEKARKALGTKYFLPTTTDDEKELIIKYSQKFVLIIDEINRANLASVFGELIYALEYRDESVESMYDIDGHRQITLPANFYIMGTMNTADRSIGHIDYAIRRRFTFVNMLPDINAVNEESKFLEVQRLFKDENNERADTLSIEFHPDDVMLGHSYFIAEDVEELQNKLEYQVKPLLLEYVKDGVLLENAEDIIRAL